MSFFSATGPLPGNLFNNLEDYVRYSGNARENAKHNWVNPNPLNPATSQTHPNFNKAVIETPWFQQRYLNRKQKAQSRNDAFDILYAENIPVHRGSRFYSLSTGQLGHTHTGASTGTGSLLLHKYDNRPSYFSQASAGPQIHT